MGEGACVRSAVLAACAALSACRGEDARSEAAAGAAGSGTTGSAVEATLAGANAAYEAKDYHTCLALFEAAAAASPVPRGGGAGFGRRVPGPHADALYNAACCHALAGDIEGAFTALDGAVATGMWAADHAEHDTDLTALHGDPRWPKVLAAMHAGSAAWERSLGDPALRKELLALVTEDQEARKAWIADMTNAALKARVGASDRATTARMHQIVATGWPGFARIGRDGSHSAWLLVQHADDDPGFQRLCLPLLAVAVVDGDAEPQDLAYLYDRVAVAVHAPQLYGTQFDKTEPAPIADLAHVDERRAAIGLASMAAYRKQIQAMYGP